MTNDFLQTPINQTTQAAQPTETQNQPAIRVNQLTKMYGVLTVIPGLNLEVEQGAIFGLIGSPGGGKTTVLKILATVLEPTSGEIWVGGKLVNDRSPENLTAIRANLGYMPDFTGTYKQTTLEEYLEFFAAAYNVPANQRKRLSKDLLELVDLADKREEYVENLPGALMQRLGLARTLINDPQILILDEPSNGMDIPGRVQLRELLKELSRMGKTILVSSPVLNELTDACTHIGLMERGQLLISGRVNDLVEQFSNNVKIIRLKLRPTPPEIMGWIYEILIRAPKVQQARYVYETSEWELYMEPKDWQIKTFSHYFMRKNLPVLSYQECTPRLDQILGRVAGDMYAKSYVY